MYVIKPQIFLDKINSMRRRQKSIFVFFMKCDANKNVFVLIALDIFNKIK